MPDLSCDDRTCKFWDSDCVLREITLTRKDYRRIWICEQYEEVEEEEEEETEEEE